MTASSELNHANDLAVGPVQAQDTFESLPRELKVVSLYLALISRRSSFNKLVEDVFLFMKDRYFIGEVLEACLEGKSWYSCTILQVREPTDEEIKKYNDCTVDSADCDQVLPPACLYHYQVQKFCNYNDINRVFEAKASQVRRKKRLITKGKLTLFLKQCLTLNSFGVWCVRETVQQDLGVDGVKFSDIFAGQPPHFPERYEKISKKSKKVLSPTQELNVRNGIVVKKESAKKSKHSTKMPPNCYPSNECSDGNDFKNNTRVVTVEGSLSSEKALQSEAKYSKKLVKLAKKKSDHKQHLGQSAKRKWRGLSWEERQKIKEKKKKRALMEKLKRREERVNAKAKREEEKLEMSLRLKERNKIREDLEREDLKALPAPQEVKCSYLPNDLFGDFMVILEFLQSFQNLFKMKKMGPRAITFNTLENALVNNAIDSPMSSIVIFFLRTIFESQDTDNETMESDAFDYAVDELTGDAVSAEAARLSSAEVASRLYKGAFFDDFTLSYLSVTEVLRLHFLNSTRGKSELVNSRNEHDCFVAGDPVSILLNKHPQLLRDLSSMHICEMPIKEKIDVLNCLVDQVLSCISVRKKIEERAEQLRQIQLEVKKAAKEAEVKRNKEVQALKGKEKREAKMKVKGENTSDIFLKTEGGELSEKELRSKSSEIEENIVKIRQLAMSFNLQPLGKDRAHRRYWVFSSLPGLFVENNPFEIGPCLSTATPKLTNSPMRSPTMMSMKNPNHKNMPQKSPSKKESDIHASAEMVSPDENTGLTENWVCTASPGCPVHKVRVPSHQWSYFTHSEDVERLIESLNKFGIRESELRKSIMRDEKWLKEVIEKSPLRILNSEEYGRKPSVPITSKTRHCNCPPGSSADTVLELELRERILNLEKRISSNCMGTLDVKDVEAWIEAIEKGGYDMQCDKLEWGFSTDLEENVLQNSVQNNQSPDKSVNNVSSPNVNDLETAASMSMKSREISRESMSSCVLEEKNGESRSSSSLESNFKSWDKRKNNITISSNLDVQSKRQTIENLASAILQLSQAVDVVYLKSPLADEETDDEKITQLKRWEICLMNSTSFCQLFLHLFLLQSSVAWSKSVVFTRCAICRRYGDGEKMLLCDECNKGHHMYCLKPKLTKVPEGDWYCMKCKPNHMNDTQKRKQERKKKRRSTHSEGVVKEYEKRPSKSRKIMHNDVCNACGLGYNLILCSACPLAYHTVCLSPPSKEVLEGTWMCSECKPGYAAEEKENKTSRSRRSSRNSVFSQAPLRDLLSDMMGHRDAWPFLRPVRKVDAPGYHIIIKKPMDLGTMKSKLNSSQYKNMSQFVADALLVFENCRMYNDKDSEVYKSGSRLSQFFKKRCAVLGIDLQD